MPRRRLPAIREGAINRKPTLAYEARKAAIIDEGLLQALTLAEEEALVDPWHRRNRTEIDGIVYDRNELGVMLAFAIDGGDVILLSFAGLFNSWPAWAIARRPDPAARSAFVQMSAVVAFATGIASTRWATPLIRA